MIDRLKIVKAAATLLLVLTVSITIGACGGAATATPSGATETASPVTTATATATALPTESPTATETPESTATETATPAQGTDKVDFQNVHFAYNSSALGTASPAEVPEENPENAPGFAITPKHIEIGFTGYPVSGNAFGPAVRLYSVSEYQALAPDQVGRHVKYMKILLESRPDLSLVFPPSGIMQPPTEDQGYGPQPPFLPLVNAASNLRARMDYVDFQDGSGIRYIAHFTQSPNPIEKEGVFYTYQGLTSDGQYWVSATFPIGVTEDYPVAPADWQNNLDKVPAYDREVADYYNHLEAQSFTPSLTELDNLIKSITIDTVP